MRHGPRLLGNAGRLGSGNRRHCLRPYQTASPAEKLDLVIRTLHEISRLRGLQIREGRVCVASLAWFHIFRTWNRWYRPRPLPRFDARFIATVAWPLAEPTDLGLFQQAVNSRTYSAGNSSVFGGFRGSRSFAEGTHDLEPPQEPRKTRTSWVQSPRNYWSGWSCGEAHRFRGAPRPQGVSNAPRMMPATTRTSPRP